MKNLPKLGAVVWAISSRIYSGVVQERDATHVKVRGLWFSAAEVHATERSALLAVANRRARALGKEYNRLSRKEDTARNALRRATEKRQRAGAAWEKAKAALAATKDGV